MTNLIIGSAEYHILGNTRQSAFVYRTSRGHL